MKSKLRKRKVRFMTLHEEEREADGLLDQLRIQLTRWVRQPYYVRYAVYLGVVAVVVTAFLYGGEKETLPWNIQRWESRLK